MAVLSMFSQNAGRALIKVDNVADLTVHNIMSITLDESDSFLTLKALGIFFSDSRFWLSIFIRFCTKSVLFYGAHCMSKSILSLKRTIPDHNRCRSHQKRQNPIEIGKVFMKKMAANPTNCQNSYFCIDL